MKNQLMSLFFFLSYPNGLWSFSIKNSNNPCIFVNKKLTIMVRRPLSTCATRRTTTRTNTIISRTSAPYAPSTRHQFTFLSSSHQELFDAEEAAAFDAHDVSDPGVEAAMMER